MPFGIRTRVREYLAPTEAPAKTRREPEYSASGRVCPQSLSVFFPMYNEQENIGQMLAQAGRVVPNLGFDDYEIVVIDDGSADGCDQIVETQAERDRHFRLVRHPHNLGYGAALRTGFQRCTRDVVFYTDSDIPVDLQELRRALPLLDDADLVIGYRVARHETLRRAIYSRIYNTLMRLLFDVQVRDVNFSFKLVRRSVLDCIQLTAGSVFIDGQLLAEARRYHFRIAQMPVEYTPRQHGSSSFNSFHAAWSTFTEMLGYWWARRRGQFAVQAHLVDRRSSTIPQVE